MIRTNIPQNRFLFFILFYSSHSKSNSSLNLLTRLCFACDISSVTKLSTRAFVSGRFTVKPSVSLRPLRTSKPDGEDVGDVDGEEEGEIAVLIFVVRLRRIGILKDSSRTVRLNPQVVNRSSFDIVKSTPNVCRRMSECDKNDRKYAEMRKAHTALSLNTYTL